VLATPAVADVPSASPPDHDERFAPADPLPPAEPVLFSPPRPRSRGPRRAFARRLSTGGWAVQVSSTTDALEAEMEREWFAGRGQSAFVMPAEVRGTRWQRVMIGRYATRVEAEASLARLRDLDVGVP
jgi:cell division protein FtsN